MLYGGYLHLFLDLNPLVTLGSHIFNESSLILQKLFKPASLLGFPFACVDIRCELASLKFLSFFGFSHGAELSFFFVQKVFHF